MRPVSLDRLSSFFGPWVSFSFGDFISMSLHTSCKKCKKSSFPPFILYKLCALGLGEEIVSYTTCNFFGGREGVQLLVHQIDSTHRMVILDNAAGLFYGNSVFVCFPRMFHFVRVHSCQHVTDFLFLLGLVFCRPILDCNDSVPSVIKFRFSLFKTGTSKRLRKIFSIRSYSAYQSCAIL